MKPSPRVIVASIASVLLILFLNTCGIEQFIQLNPPTTGAAFGDQFSFLKTYYNSESEFKGFDLYYRLYTVDESPDLNAIIEFEDLAANQYWRVHRSSDVKNVQIQRPLIPIDLNDRDPSPNPPESTNDSFTLTVDFTSVIDTFPKIVDDGTTALIDRIDVGPPEVYEPSLPDPPPILIEITDIRRGANYETISREDEFKRFSDFNAGDVGKDLSAEVWQKIDTGAAVKIVLYAVSYGYSFAQNRTLYSEPLRLGEIVRVFPEGDP
jgi:hypothetical protein